eukprot:8672069-Lingulodinium_polyedra.AAC.1
MDDTTQTTLFLHATTRTVLRCCLGRENYCRASAHAPRCPTATEPNPLQLVDQGDRALRAPAALADLQGVRLLARARC